MTTYVIRIKRDGSVIGLYDDRLPYLKIGATEIKRASDVRWNDKKQGWEIFIVDENRALPRVYEKRAQAIEAEVDYLQNKRFAD